MVVAVFCLFVVGCFFGWSGVVIFSRGGFLFYLFFNFKYLF